MILKELKIQTWVGDPTNCYIIFDEKSKETMVIDPAGGVDKIQEMINSQEFKEHPELFTSQTLAHAKIKEIQKMINLIEDQEKRFVIFA